MKALIFILLITAVVLPYVSYNFDEPLSARQLEALTAVGKIALAKAVFVFLLNFVTGNYSQVDKLWSLMPGVYAWVLTYYGDFNQRQMIMSSLVTLWGLRLTFNFARKGGYSLRVWEGEEDYRWAVLRKNPIFANAVVWFFFNLFFISFYQTFLILSFTFPWLLTISDKVAAPLGLLDFVAAGLIVGFILIETFADEQQWAF